MNGPLPVIVAALLALAPIAVLPGAGMASDGVGTQNDVTAPTHANSHSAVFGAEWSLGVSSPATSTSSGHLPSRATDAALPIRERANASNYLALAGPLRRSNFTTVGLDVAGSLAADNARIHGQYHTLRLEVAFAAAENDSARRLVLLRATERLDSRITTLERRQREALAAYNAGALSTRQFLRELAIIDATADSLRETVELLETYNNEVPSSLVTDTRIDTFRARLVPLRGPVRSHVASVMAGSADPTRVYVGTSESGIVLSTIVDDEFDFVREAYVPAHRDPTAPDRFGEDSLAALDRLQELYPWVMAHQAGYRTPINSPRQASVYVFVVNYPRRVPLNTLTTYLDGGTRTSFREFQQQDLRLVNFEPPVTNASDGVLLLVNRTYHSGPLEIRVRDNETGEPLSATVFVEGERVGVTGPDGRLWTLTPSGDFTLTVIHEGETVSVTTTSAPLG